MNLVRHISPNSVNTLVLSDRVLVRVVTDKGIPVPGILCRVTFSDKRAQSGRTDNRGTFIAPHDLDEVDDVTVAFPSLTGSVWSEKGGGA
ncbi:MAG: hypothetical protein JKY37_34120 [Nannocystaceae bacterium]|nr:hypothetical protein [Nannocystaceae bacterium]